MKPIFAGQTKTFELGFGSQRSGMLVFVIGDEKAQIEALVNGQLMLSKYGAGLHRQAQGVNFDDVGLCLNRPGAGE
ncbi:hypothetical protein ACFST9_24670 [Hymenobacter monticola]